tara:strand:- start:366 stop:2357 length:1992 start_codon:yes stop_codon:yes gene_type:complete
MNRIINLRRFSSIPNRVMNLKIKDSIGIVEFNNPKNSVNIINQDFSKDLEVILNKYDEENLNAIIFKSTKSNNFIAGADIQMLKKSSEEELSEILDNGHKLINKLGKINSIASINGSCLGGGLEFAMACKYRIVSNSNKTVLGLPEVKLGLLPGMGGTQFFPKLVGLRNGLLPILTGSNIRPKKAKKLGLVDYVVDEKLLDITSLQIANSLPNIKREKHLLDSLLSKLILKKAEKDIIKKTNGLYPSPIKIIEVLKKTYSKNKNLKKENLKLEKDLFMELLKSNESKSLIKIFNDTNKLKEKYKNYNNNISKVSIIGSGLMGTGIANVTIKNKISTNIYDINSDNLTKSINKLYQSINKDFRKGKIIGFEKDKLHQKISSNNNFYNSDIVIEAVSEDLNIKENIFKMLDNKTDKSTVLASNTSSLSINDIAKFSKYPERVIGMHYFSPVEKMPLLEIIKGNDTNEETLSKAISLGKKQGKTIIIVKDVPGFFVNRCLTPYMSEALHILCEGHNPSVIDNIMTSKGFPVGPFTLMDEVGLDICNKVNQMLKPDLNGRITDPIFDITGELIKNNYLGKKSGKGFYDYSNKKKKENLDVLKNFYREKSNLSKDQIFDRLLNKFITETQHCLKEEIIESEVEGNIGAIFGTGFPPYTGGPFNIEKNN